MAPSDTRQLRRLGNTELAISPVALGCWPIAGVSSVDVNDRDSLRTIDVALAAGVNFLDTAFMYGYDGESERLIGRAVTGRRDRVVVATKCGIHWSDERIRVFDSRPESLRRECNASLQRLGMDHVDLLYLHAWDKNTPLTDVGGAFRKLLDDGKARAIGVSNLTIEQMEQFQSECPIAAVQPPYSMLQRQIEFDLIPWCQEREISVIVYWPLMKGLLAGHLKRDHVFDPQDGRPKYPMFQGEEWQKNQDFVDRLRELAQRSERSVSQIVINWTIHQPGIAASLCGAKRAYQIEETAGSMGWQLSDDELRFIDDALADRGTPISESAV